MRLPLFGPEAFGSLLVKVSKVDKKPWGTERKRKVSTKNDSTDTKQTALIQVGH